MAISSDNPRVTTRRNGSSKRAAKRKKRSYNSMADPPPPAGAYKLEPAAKYLGGLSEPTMHRLIQRGLLVPVRKIRHLLFTRVELDRFLNTDVTREAGIGSWSLTWHCHLLFSLSVFPALHPC